MSDIERRDAQGEDERALVELFTAWLDGEYDKESFLFGFHFDKGQREGSVAGYRNMATGFRAGYLAALSFRPAEPDEMEGMQSCGPNGPEGHDAIPRKPAQAALASERGKRERETKSDEPNPFCPGCVREKIEPPEAICDACWNGSEYEQCPAPDVTDAEKTLCED